LLALVVVVVGATPRPAPYPSHLVLFGTVESYSVPSYPISRPENKSMATAVDPSKVCYLMMGLLSHTTL
jgi:hypothetical protein